MSFYCRPFNRFNSIRFSNKHINEQWKVTIGNGSKVGVCIRAISTVGSVLCLKGSSREDQQWESLGSESLYAVMEDVKPDIAILTDYATVYLCSRHQRRPQRRILSTACRASSKHSPRTRKGWRDPHRNTAFSDKPKDGLILRKTPKSHIKLQQDVLPLLFLPILQGGSASAYRITNLKGGHPEDAIEVIPPSSTDRFPCDVCPKGYPRKSELSRHIRKNPKTCGKDKLVTCRLCTRMFSKGGLNRHLSESHKEGQFVCDLCGKQFLCEITIWEHWRNKSGTCGKGKGVQCKVCRGSFKNMLGLRVHQTRSGHGLQFHDTYAPPYNQDPLHPSTESLPLSSTHTLEDGTCTIPLQCPTLQFHHPPHQEPYMTSISPQNGLHLNPHHNLLINPSQPPNAPSHSLYQRPSPIMYCTEYQQQPYQPQQPLNSNPEDKGPLPSEITSAPASSSSDSLPPSTVLPSFQQTFMTSPRRYGMDARSRVHLLSETGFGMRY